MNKLFSKLDRYIDYNNSYSINKALSTLHREFKLAISGKNVVYARVVLNATKMMHTKLHDTYRESEDLGETMSYSQRMMSRKIKQFMAYLVSELKAHFGISNRSEEIEQAIGT